MTSTASWSLRIRMISSLILFAVFGVLFLAALGTLFLFGVPRMIDWWSIAFEANSELGSWILIGGFALIFIAAGTVFSNLYFSPTDETDARIVEPEAYPDLHRTVERLALEMDLPVPSIGIVDSSVPNAYTHGVVPSKSTLVVTTGLLDVLNDDELEAVIAHELAHINHRDAAIMSVGYLLPAVTFALVRTFMLPFDRGSSDSGSERSTNSSRPPKRRRSRRGRRRNSGLWVLFMPTGGNGPSGDNIKAALALFGIFLITAILTFAISITFWIATSLTLVFLSRTREHAADRAAAAVTGNPYALESALKTIHNRMESLPTEDLREVDGAVETVYFAPLKRGMMNREDALLVSDDIFPDTHPPIERRVEHIEEFAHE